MNILFMAITVVVAASQQGAFRTAGDEFLKGGYDAAIEGYSSVIAAGVKNPDVYYNLGNAYLASGRTGLAVLSYERALLLDPGDADARANLELAKKPLQDEAAFTRAIKNPVDDLLHRLPVGTVMVPAVVLWAALFLLLMVRRIMPMGAFRSGLSVAAIPVGVLALVFVILSAGAVWVRDYRPRAVVLSGSAVLKEGPNQSFKTLIGLREGLTVEVKGDENGWVKVTLPGGVNGWVRGETIERI
ncbi:MAG: tetratricopeptide repeat protein [Myxococcota bacterium]|jgi:hypothetical protein